MNLPLINRRGNSGKANVSPPPGGGTITIDDHLAQSNRAERSADKYLIAGVMIMATAVAGIFGLPLFLWGLKKMRDATRAGLTVRPIMVTLVGYLVMLDAALNIQGWILDLIANQNLIYRVFYSLWGNMFDNGYSWHYNQLWIGGTSAPGEKSWEIAMIVIVFPMRVAACIAFLQMKRWGYQWLVVSCWTGPIIWVGYVVNMTMYADIRYAGTNFPVLGWWGYDILYMAAFLAIPYLHTCNREIFTD